jgi:hypothetical protein
MNKYLILAAVLAQIAIIVASFYGYIYNVIQLSGGDFDNLTPLLVLRFIGIFIPPLGVLLGFI